MSGASIDERLEAWLEERADEYGIDELDGWTREEYIEHLRHSLSYDSKRLDLALSDLKDAIREMVEPIVVWLARHVTRTLP